MAVEEDFYQLHGSISPRTELSLDYIMVTIQDAELTHSQNVIIMLKENMDLVDPHNQLQNALKSAMKTTTLNITRINSSELRCIV